MRRLILFIGCFVCISILNADEDVVKNEIVNISNSLPQCTLELPKGWKKETNEIPQGILMVYIGDSKKEIIPTINVAWESSNLPSSAYLKQSKKAHLTIDHSTCKEMGTLNCAAGKLYLLQIDRVTNWGNFRFLQGMIVKNGIAYVVTGSASQDDFATLSGQFFTTFQSFNVQ